MCKGDSGASKHYFRDEDKKVLQNIQRKNSDTIVQLPNNATIHSNKIGTLPIPELSNAAKATTIFSGLTNSSLISIGQLCDDNCIAILNKNTLKVIKNNKVIMEGQRNHDDGLYDIPIVKERTKPVSIQQKANVIINKNQANQQLASYYHSCLFSPTIRTLQNAVNKGNLIGFPGITNIKFQRDLPQSMATAKGHLDQEQQGLQSTKTSLQSDPHIDYSPNPEPKTQDCVLILTSYQDMKKGYMDLCGRFPHRSSRGSEYILVLYDYDSNAILVEALRSRQAGEITRAWKVLHNRLLKRHSSPNLYIMDNEWSATLAAALQKYTVTFQLATPYMHRTNAAERAIRTFKNHFIAGLCSVDPDFPITEWDRLLEQGELSLNLLRNARSNPKLSSYAYLEGNYDFNAHPMAPPGTLLAVHVKPTKRASWSPHSIKGWYIGPALNHYRNFSCFIPSTQQVVTSDTVEIFPHHNTIPTISQQDYLQKAIIDILSILQSNKPFLPHQQPTESQTDAIVKIATLLNRAESKPKPIIKPSPIDPPEDCHHISKIPRVKCGSPTTVKSFSSESTLKINPNSFKAKAANFIASKEFFTFKVNHIYDNNGKKETIDSLRKKFPEIWDKSLSNEWGRLAQGNKYGIIGTNTIDFINFNDLPQAATVTYASFVCDYRPLKSEPWRVRIVVGGDRLTYAEDAGSPTTDMLETKILINSVISDADKGARFLSLDLKDYFLASPMKNPEYMKVHISKFPSDIIQQYHLHSLVTKDGYIYIKIKKGMYGLRQAAILAYDQLVKFMKHYGYSPEMHTVGLWSHDSKPTKFCLCVDDFGVKYYSKNDANHLINALQAYYKISIDWDGTTYCDLTLQ